MLSSIKKSFLFIIILAPDTIRLKGINKAITPKDWRKISAAKLPRNPRIFLISVLFGKIKFGSSGEKVINEISNKIPDIKIVTPTISITLFTTKFTAVLANFFNFNNKN